jgi:hypothetical protein
MVQEGDVAVSREMRRHHNEHVSMSCIARYQAYNETKFPKHMPTGHGLL